MVSYCKQLSEYFKDEGVKREFTSLFISQYNKFETEDFERQVEEEGYKNGVLASLSGTQKLGKKLADNLHDANEVLPSNSKQKSISNRCILKKVNITGC